MQRTTWILVADGARARIVVNEGPRAGLMPLGNADYAASHAPSRDFGADRPGRSRRGADGSRHAVGPRVDWHHFEKHQFAKSMAAIINGAANRNALQGVVLVAPPKILGALRLALDPKVAKMIRGEIRKDLTHLDIEELADHLKEVIPLKMPAPLRFGVA